MGYCRQFTPSGIGWGVSPPVRRQVLATKRTNHQNLNGWKTLGRRPQVYGRTRRRYETCTDENDQKEHWEKGKKWFFCLSKSALLDRRDKKLFFFRFFFSPCSVGPFFVRRCSLDYLLDSRNWFIRGGGRGSLVVIRIIRMMICIIVFWSFYHCFWSFYYPHPFTDERVILDFDVCDSRFWCTKDVIHILFWAPNTWLSLLSWAPNNLTLSPEYVTESFVLSPEYATAYFILSFEYVIEFFILSPEYVTEFFILSPEYATACRVLYLWCWRWCVLYCWVFRVFYAY